MLIIRKDSDRKGVPAEEKKSVLQHSPFFSCINCLKAATKTNFWFWLEIWFIQRWYEFIMNHYQELQSAFDSSKSSGLTLALVNCNHARLIPAYYNDIYDSPSAHEKREFSFNAPRNSAKTVYLILLKRLIYLWYSWAWIMLK